LASGINPSAVKRAAREARETRKGAPTVSGRLAQWRTARAADWSDRYRTEVERLCAKTIEPALGKRRLIETSRVDWTGLLATVRERTPGTASYLYSVLSSFLNFSEAHGWVDVPLLPRKGQSVIAPRLEDRERVLADNEIIAIWNAAGELSPRSRAFVRVMILCGTRVSETASIAIGEIDFENMTWSIPKEKAKNRQPIVLPLGALALAELASVRPPDGAGPGHCLLGAVEGSALKAPSKIKARLDRLSSVTNWRFHDLRRSTRTGLARLGVEPHIAERCVNHITATKLQRIYDRYDYASEIIAAMGRWQSEVARLVRADEAKRMPLRLVSD
jgi:integrase